MSAPGEPAASGGASEAVELLAAARAAARAACALLVGARPHQVRAKGNPRDLVTEWDLRSEEVIRAELGRRAPGVAILGEEGGLGGDGPTPAGGLRWLVDPIDGTVNFAHGLPIWSVSIAVERAGALLAGVVAAPALGWWFEAVDGGGARAVTGGWSPAEAPAVEAIAVSAQGRLDHALLSTGFPYDRATSPENNFAEWEHLQRRAGACRRLGSASLDLCLVGCGWLDGYWERKLQPWDVAAGALVVREAGGRVTDTRGGRFDPHGGEVVATNGGIHDELVAELARVRGGPAR